MDASIPQLADACQERLFPSGVFAGTIQYEHTILDMGQVELALIEKCLRHVERRDNLLVVNPFTTKLTPAFLILSYMSSADPRQPSDLQTTDGAPALLFPDNSVGYLGELGQFNYRDELSSSGIYDRDPIRSMDVYSTDGEFQLYSVATPDIQIPENGYDRIGLLFVDLRNDAWQQNFDLFEQLLEAYHVDSVLFYSDMQNAGTDAAEQIVADTLEVNRGSFTATDTADPGENPTPARIQEYILNDTLQLSFPVRHSPDIDAGLRRLYAIRSELTDAYEDTVFIELLNGLLLDLPVAPSRYDDMAAQNAFYQTTESLIRNIDDRATVTSGEESRLCEQFVAQAREVRQALEHRHPKQAALDALVDESRETDTPVRLVARNLMFKQALERHLFAKYGSIPETIELCRATELTPDYESRTVFTSVPNANDEVYAFPPSNEITILTYPFFVDTVIERFDGSQFDGGSPSVEVVERPSSEPPEPDDADAETDTEQGVVDLSNIEVDISPSLTDTSSESDEGETTRGDGPTIELTFADSTTREMPVSQRVTVYDRDADDIERKTAGQVSPDDHLVITDEAASDLYEEVIDIKHNQTEVQDQEQFVDRWRELLNDILARDEMASERLLNQMQDEGSSLSTTTPIKQWAAGEVLGPRDIDDVRIVLKIADPRYEDQYDRVYEAMEYIRTLHRQTGRRVKQVIIAELDPSRSANLDSDLAAHLEEVIDQAEIKRVTGVSR